MAGGEDDIGQGERWRMFPSSVAASSPTAHAADHVVLVALQRPHPDSSLHCLASAACPSTAPCLILVSAARASAAPCLVLEPVPPEPIATSSEPRQLLLVLDGWTTILFAAEKREVRFEIGNN
ncbi:hypothetical protein GUJ93_ZPchr0008g13620 [Zizania palustris]|uniref:Uncharacterized protein n=1 Tax=Zizania palustris TaxID=103762 RepID=A0A8J5V3F4_ZIZPA|nr:hypothetical protein GUJ93_ZPchr0008g13620 [Zizania palustris]